jgi:hypothetical protein
MMCVHICVCVCVFKEGGGSPLYVYSLVSNSILHPYEPLPVNVHVKTASV